MYEHCTQKQENSAIHLSQYAIRKLEIYVVYVQKIKRFLFSKTDKLWVSAFDMFIWLFGQGQVIEK